MIFVMGFISIVVVAALVRPLLVRAPNDQGSNALEAAIGEHQRRLADLERDLERGAISKDDGDLARAEIARQLLREKKALEQAAPAAAPISSPSVSKLGRLIPILIIALIPVGAGLVYWKTGNPGYADQPLKDRAAILPSTDEATTASQLPAFISQLEARLATHPDEAQGWALLARSYEATQDGDNAQRAWQGLLVADPGNADALWFLGVNAARTGKNAQARAFWLELRKRYEPGSDDYKLLSEALATLN